MSDTPLFDSIINGREQDIKKVGAYEVKSLAPWITCADGENLSVQASAHHYCSPRTDRGPYYEVEVGYPTAAPPETWAEYFDGTWGHEEATDGVYGFIPVELVREFIMAHGGEKQSKGDTA